MEINIILQEIINEQNTVNSQKQLLNETLGTGFTKLLKSFSKTFANEFYAALGKNADEILKMKPVELSRLIRDSKVPEMIKIRKEMASKLLDDNYYFRNIDFILNKYDLTIPQESINAGRELSTKLDIDPGLLQDVKNLWKIKKGTKPITTTTAGATNTVPPGHGTAAPTVPPNQTFNNIIYKNSDILNGVIDEIKHLNPKFNSKEWSKILNSDEFYKKIIPEINSEIRKLGQITDEAQFKQEIQNIINYLKNRGYNITAIKEVETFFQKKSVKVVAKGGSILALFGFSYEYLLPAIAGLYSTKIILDKFTFESIDPNTGKSETPIQKQQRQLGLGDYNNNNNNPKLQTLLKRYNTKITKDGNGKNIIKIENYPGIKGGVILYLDTPQGGKLRSIKDPNKTGTWSIKNLNEGLNLFNLISEQSTENFDFSFSWDNESHDIPYQQSSPTVKQTQPVQPIKQDTVQQQPAQSQNTSRPKLVWKNCTGTYKPGCVNKTAIADVQKCLDLGTRNFPNGNGYYDYILHDALSSMGYKNGFTDADIPIICKKSIENVKPFTVEENDTPGVPTETPRQTYEKYYVKLDGKETNRVKLKLSNLPDSDLENLNKYFATQGLYKIKNPKRRYGTKFVWGKKPQ